MSLVIIFTVLIAVSIPNFIISLRRARDQTRRDDMGSLQTFLGEYVRDVESFPPASSDGRVSSCVKSGTKPAQDNKGNWIIDYIPCNWGEDPLKNPITDKIYISLLPRDPDYQKGAAYLYFSDGKRYQIYAAMEGMDEAEIDPIIVARNLSCGNRTCNIGRAVGVPINMSIEEYNKSLLTPNVEK